MGTSLHDAKTQFSRDYPRRWERMLSEWRHPPQPRMMWLMYAANYLFSTHGVRWAVDPLVPGHLADDLPRDVPTEALEALAFVLLTHAHRDHVDYALLAALRGTSVRFVVPEVMLTQLVERAAPLERQIVVARPGQRLELDGIGIRPFVGWHWEQPPHGPRTGVDATGYLVEVGDRRWLLPGDVRDYNPQHLAGWGPVDCLFAHLWLGRGCGEMDAPPLLEDFCAFLAASAPRTVVLTHLWEFSRVARDLWTQRHADLVVARGRDALPGVPMMVPRIGEGMVL